jgi:signal transduction histidine kinase
MKLRTRLVVTSLAVAIPIAILIYEVSESLRARDMRTALDRFVTSQMTDDFRDRCDSNPNWFLAGPRPDRPKPEVLAAPDADVIAPRPPTHNVPFEYFAYDETFTALSSAGPRFPADLRLAMRRGANVVTGPFNTNLGTGFQEAILTGWTNTPCAAVLFRMWPKPGQTSERVWFFLMTVLVVTAVALLAGGPIVLRIRRLGLEARQSASEEYRSSVVVGGRDEMSALAFAFNEAASDIRRRATDVKDREESLRRYIASTTESVTAPLIELERRLGDLQSAAGGAEPRAGIQQAVADAHAVAMRLQNLSAAATLRMSSESAGKGSVDLNALVQRVLVRQTPFANASQVTLSQAAADRDARLSADTALLEQAVNNLVDNGIRYNRAGGQVLISVDRTRDGRVSLRVSDDGPGAPDEVLSRLNANRRFRGDEGRAKRSGELGLGLAVVREVCDRFGIQWAFRKSARGWFEAELTGGTSGT